MAKRQKRTQAGGHGAGMKRTAISRMRRIYGWLVEGRYPNCTTMAQELEVGRKTVLRDLECLRDVWMLPIDYDQIRHGYFLAKDVKRAPWGPVSEAELFAVAVTQKVLESYQGLPLQKPLEAAFAKMTRVLDEDERYTLGNLDAAFSVRPFAPEDPDVKVLELVMRAVSGNRVLRFSYRKPGEKRAEERQVHPYHVMEHQGRLYLLGHDVGRGAVRTFALGRIGDAQVLEEQFERPEDFDPKKVFEKSLGVMRGTGDYRVVIELDAWLTDILRGRRFHPSQEVQELPGGGAHLRLRLSGLEEIEQYVLSWGVHATVIEPEALRGRIEATAAAVARRYAQRG